MPHNNKTLTPRLRHHKERMCECLCVHINTTALENLQAVHRQISCYRHQNNKHTLEPTSLPIAGPRETVRRYCSTVLGRIGWNDLHTLLLHTQCSVILLVCNDLPNYSHWIKSKEGMKPTTCPVIWYARTHKHKHRLKPAICNHTAWSEWLQFLVAGEQQCHLSGQLCNIPFLGWKIFSINRHSQSYSEAN